LGVNRPTPFKKIPDSGREDLFDDLLEICGRPLPEIRSPFLADLPSGFKEVGSVESKSERAESGRSQGMVRDRMEELAILHSLFL